MCDNRIREWERESMNEKLNKCMFERIKRDEKDLKGNKKGFTKLLTPN